MIIAGVTFLIAVGVIVYRLYTFKRIINHLEKEFPVPPANCILGHLPDFYKKDLPGVSTIFVCFCFLNVYYMQF